MSKVGWKKTENCKPVISVTLSEDLIERVEDARFENRINSRSETIEQLIRLGLRVLEKRKQRLA